MTSRTAEYVALFRALESRRSRSGRWFVDPYAGEFLSGVRRLAAGIGRSPLTAYLLARLIDLRWPGPRTSATVRTKVIDDAVTAAVAGGIDQMVTLGAGFDTRPARLACLRSASCFEVDRAETQALKKQTMERVDPDTGARVTYLAADLASTDLAATLTRAGVDPSRRVVFVWEGVTNYLDAATVVRALESMREASSPGSVLVFTYVDSRALLDPSPFPEATAWAARVASAGEPFTYGMDPGEVPSLLARLGWKACRDVSTAEAATEMSRCLRHEAGSDLYRVVVARPISNRPSEAADAQDH